MAEGIYRVEKDGRSFHIHPEALDYYANNGYTIYKSVEVEIDDVSKELDNDISSNVENVSSTEG